jgi:mRNA interferase MazF
MGKFVKGDIVVIPFPFSDLSASKKRPALVLADLPGDDIILCQITSQSSSDPNAIPVANADMISGNLVKSGYVRPTRLFTADKNIILRKVATVNAGKYGQVVQKI